MAGLLMVCMRLQKCSATPDLSSFLLIMFHLCSSTSFFDVLAVFGFCYVYTISIVMRI